MSTVESAQCLSFEDGSLIITKPDGSAQALSIGSTQLAQYILDIYTQASDQLMCVGSDRSEKDFQDLYQICDTLGVFFASQGRPKSAREIDDLRSSRNSASSGNEDDAHMDGEEIRAALDQQKASNLSCDDYADIWKNGDLQNPGVGWKQAQNLFTKWIAERLDTDEDKAKIARDVKLYLVDLDAVMLCAVSRGDEQFVEQIESHRDMTRKSMRKMFSG